MRTAVETTAEVEEEEAAAAVVVEKEKGNGNKSRPAGLNPLIQQVVGGSGGNGGDAKGGNVRQL